MNTQDKNKFNLKIMSLDEKKVNVNDIVDGEIDFTKITGKCRIKFTNIESTSCSYDFGIILDKIDNLN